MTKQDDHVRVHGRFEEVVNMAPAEIEAWLELRAGVIP
ncbi:DUF3140 domain-containing protein [Sphingomonas sp. UNC305MFCol5.2]|nr:DUF3140 domain-containing protein [Sphingomonas sp. UNC305MFCol5.2]